MCIRDRLKGRRVGYVKGFPANRDERDEGEFLRAVSAAEHADVAVVFAGLPESFVSPDADRRTCLLYTSITASTAWAL